MNWEAIGAVGESVGAAAVVISLVYLAIQVRQNTDSNRLLSAQNLVNQNAASLTGVALNPEVASLMHRGMEEGHAALTPEERFRFNAYMLFIYNQFELAYHQFVAGNIDAKIWHKFAYEIPYWLSLPGGKQWYAQDKERYSPEFRDYVASALENYTLPEMLPTMGRSIASGSTRPI